MDNEFESQRYINLNEYDILDNPEGNAKSQEWLKANGIDPSYAPSHQYVCIHEDHMSIMLFKRNELGTKEIGPAGYEKVVVQIPMIVRPEVFGI